MRGARGVSAKIKGEKKKYRRKPLTIPTHPIGR